MEPLLLNAGLSIVEALITNFPQLQQEFANLFSTGTAPTLSDWQNLRLRVVMDSYAKYDAKALPPGTNLIPLPAAPAAPVSKPVSPTAPPATNPPPPAPLSPPNPPAAPAPASSLTAEPVAQPATAGPAAVVAPAQATAPATTLHPTDASFTRVVPIGG